MRDVFPAELTERTFQSANGEFGWSRADALIAISLLVDARCAILGGELWWVPENATEWTGLIPQRIGPDGVYPWDTERIPNELWQAFVERCAHDSVEAVSRWPGINDLPVNLGGRILYNLTWVTESEYETLGQQAV